MLNKLLLLIFFLFISQLALTQQNELVDKPKLVIQIIVEQMRYDILQRYWERFSEKGFKRLIKNGTFCKNAYYDFMLTESAPGYATISTGANPSEHGIVSDDWYVMLRNKEQNCTAAPKLVDRNEVFDRNKFSPKQLIGSTLGDELRISNYKRSKVVSISINNHASVLTAGYMPSAAYWMDENTAYWTSSSHYMDSLPPWVNNFNQKQLVQLYLSREWNTIKPIGSYQKSLADNNSYEIGFSNNQKTFPYNLNRLSLIEGAKIIKYTPFGNSYTTSFAVASMFFEELGKDKFTDLLTISYATTAYVINLFGVRSIELEDVYIRLDKEIEHLLNVIDDRFGKENVTF